MFEFAAGNTGSARARDRHAAHAELVQVAFHRCLTVAAVGGDRAWWTSGAAGDPFDRRRQLWCVRRISDLNVVVEDDPVGVVGELGFIAELHRLAKSTFADRARVGIVQADQPARRLGHHPA